MARRRKIMPNSAGAHMHFKLAVMKEASRARGKGLFRLIICLSLPFSPFRAESAPREDIHLHPQRTDFFSSSPARAYTPIKPERERKV